MKDERILFDLNKELAILMGWKLKNERVVEFAGGIVRYIHTFAEGISPNHPFGPPNIRFPDFIYDRTEFFELLMQFQPEIKFGDGFVSSFIKGEPEGVSCFFEEWDNKETATVVAVMQSVIKKLKEEQRVRKHIWILVKEFYDGVDCSTEVISAFDTEDKAKTAELAAKPESAHTYYITKVELF